MAKTAAELEKEIEKLKGDLETATKAGAPVADLTTKVEEMTKVQKELTDKLAAVEAEKAEALAKADMTDAEKAHYGKLKDDAEKKKFLALKSEERAVIIKAAESDDEVVKIAGQDIRKSVVGAQQFSIFKAQAEEIAKLQKANAEAIDKAETVEITKRVETEFALLPGDTATKVAVLKSVASAKMSEENSKAFDAMLKAGNDALKGAFKPIGIKGGKDINKADGDTFINKVTEIEKRDRIPRMAAMEKARLEFPEEFKAYQEKGAEVGEDNRRTA